MKFIHIADVHLGAVPDVGYPWSEERKTEIWDSFRNIIRIAKAEQADLLLIAGDLFHRQPLLKELKEVNYLFSTLTETRVVFIIGNHDYLKPDSFYHGFKWNENVICLENQDCQRIHFPDLNTTVYGLSYHTREITNALYDELVPEDDGVCTILLAHGGDEKHIPINKRQLCQAGFDYVALGHIHKPQILEANRMAYSGALEPLDKNDTGPHGYMIGEYRKRTLTARFIPSAVREYIHLKVETDETQTDYSLQEKIQAYMKKLGGHNIYKIIITGYRDPDIQYELKSYEKLGNIVEVADMSKPAYDFAKLWKKYADSVVGRYIQRLNTDSMDEVQSKALYYGIQAMLETTR